MTNFDPNVDGLLTVETLRGFHSQQDTFVNTSVDWSTIASACFCALRTVFVD